ncbi:MAG: hypothetical protein ABEH35_06290 [Haloarculaceae archaeon]
MTRYATEIEDGTVYVGSENGRIEVGEVDEIIDAVGGPAWTISYSEETRERYPDLDTSDEGLTVDVVDVLHSMTHGEQFVETLAAHPDDPPETGDSLSPRLGLFVGKLLENLEHGIS